MQNQAKNKQQFLSCIAGGYYIFVIAFYLCTLIIRGFPVGICSALLMMMIAVILVATGKIGFKISRQEVLVLIYVLYCVSSVAWVGMHGINISVYVKSITNSLFPIIFYFYAKWDNGIFYKTLLYAVTICDMVGLLLLLLMPFWYQIYCISNGYSFTRLSSCIGSTAVGSLNTIAILISVRQIYLTHGKKGKLYYIFFFICAFASMQRSAWIVVFFFLTIFHYLFFFKWRRLKLRYLCAEIGGISLLGIFARRQILNMAERWLLEHDVSGETGMFTSRSGQWMSALKTSNILFGNGYGTVGHKAIGYVNHVVADGSWVCMLCEIGIVGLGVFILIFLLALQKGINKFNVFFLPIAIIVAVALQAIGSNMFEYQIIMPVFWYAIGDICHKKTQKEMVQSNESIGNISSAVS